MWIGQQAPLQRGVLLLLVTTQIYKQGDYEPCYPFHGAQYLLDLSGTLVLSAAIRIHHLKIFDSELQVINADVV